MKPDAAFCRAHRLAQRLRALQDRAVRQLLGLGLHCGRARDEGNSTLAHGHAFHVVGEEFAAGDGLQQGTCVHVQEVCDVLARWRVQDPVGPVAYFDEQGTGTDEVAGRTQHHRCMNLQGARRLSDAADAPSAGMRRPGHGTYRVGTLAGPGRETKDHGRPASAWSVELSLCRACRRRIVQPEQSNRMMLPRRCYEGQCIAEGHRSVPHCNCSCSGMQHGDEALPSETHKLQS